MINLAVCLTFNHNVKSLLIHVFCDLKHLKKKERKKGNNKSNQNLVNSFQVANLVTITIDLAVKQATIQHKRRFR